MTKTSSLAIGAFLALSTVALAHAQESIAGAWKLSIGATDPCMLTLSADPATAAAGVVTPSTECPFTAPNAPVSVRPFICGYARKS